VPEPVEPARVEAPRLVVLVVYDQLGAAVLDRQLPRLSEDGAIRRTIASGQHTRVRYPYAATFTAVGHAAIVSGAPPYLSGIAANNVIHPERGRIPVMDDGEHRILGRDNAFASPSRMRAISVADVLHRESAGRAIIASISMKDRSAILPAGRSPDLCLWFDRRANGFTTSSYYAEALPAWVTAWQSEHPWQSYLQPPWEPEDAAALERDLGPDQQLGEGAYGYTAVFPHDATGLEEIDAFLSLPRSVEMQIGIAERAVEELGMGADNTTDFLAISISATDYTGHAFGPDSWEYADVLLRADRMVGEFLARLEERMSVAVLITSDHGVGAMTDRHEGAVRFTSEVEIVALRGALGESAVLGWAQPFVYLSDDADRARAIELISARPGVLAAVDAREGAALRDDTDRVRRMMGLSLPDNWPGDILVMPREHSVANEELPEGFGTSHGSPWDYDTVVPAIYAGPNVLHGDEEDVLPQARVATTIAYLLGVDPPPASATTALPGVRPLSR
jgi:predicted AlkP superfamily pyrophosphatase or phosphodiesterase